jgi:V/A-type H+-transporting ATPase subunit E|uniref:V-type ATP synthase subunit E n=1 Tax=Desulfobacca acetoxidans TaxID=60893 RepID=A0A7V6A5L2_9BACT
MALFDRVELFCQAILDQGRAEAERLLRQARERHDALVAQAQKERQAALQRAQGTLQAEGRVEARAIIDRAHLESKRRLAHAKEAILTEVRQEAQARLLAFRETPDYPLWLHRKLVEAVNFLGGSRFQVKVHPEEVRWLHAQLLEQVRQETGAELELDSDPGMPPGGFVVLTADQRMRLDQTFQGLAARREEALRTQLARILWES